MRRGLEGCRTAVEADAVQAGGFLEMFDYYYYFFLSSFKLGLYRAFTINHAKFSRKLR